MGGNLAVERFAFSVSMSLCSVNASSMVDRVVSGASRYESGGCCLWQSCMCRG